MKKLIALLFALMLLCACGAEPVEEPEEETEYTEDYYDRKFMDEVLTDEERRENIFSALTDININTEFIKDFEKIEDESGDEKYSFTYRENSLTVTMDEDSTVASVRVGEDGEDVYLKGYEPYDVEDYIITSSMIGGFKSMIINAIEISFDYPSVYEIASDWTYRHDDCYYYAKGTVLIGADKEEHFMEKIYYYEEAENTMHWYSLKVDGNEITLPIEFQQYEKPERKPTSGN